MRLVGLGMVGAMSCLTSRAASRSTRCTNPCLLLERESERDIFESEIFREMNDRSRQHKKIKRQRVSTIYLKIFISRYFASSISRYLK